MIFDAARIWVVAGFAVGAVTGPVVSAQEPAATPAAAPAGAPAGAGPSAAPPSQDPALTDPTVGEDLLDQERQRPSPAPVEPDASAPGQRVIPSVPGVERLSFALPNRKFRTEGAYVTRLVGAVMRLPSGEHVFLPDVPTDGTAGDQPMLLMPSQRLSQIASAADNGQSSVGMSISGQAFVYRGRQYLLPSTFSLVNNAGGGARPTGAAQPTGATTPATPDGTAAGGGADAGANSGTGSGTGSGAGADPRVDDLIRDLETRSRGQRLLAPAADAGDAGDAARQAAEPQMNLLPEGQIIMNRRGRLVRLSGSDGRFAMVFDNDPDSPGTGPLVILPCRVLETMEGLAMPRGDEATFRVSGRVLVYEGRNYLLPTLAQLERPADLMPMQ